MPGAFFRLVSELSSMGTFRLMGTTAPGSTVSCYERASTHQSSCGLVSGREIYMSTDRCILSRKALSNDCEMGNTYCCGGEVDAACVCRLSLRNLLVSWRRHQLFCAAIESGLCNFVQGNRYLATALDFVARGTQF